MTRDPSEARDPLRLANSAPSDGVRVLVPEAVTAEHTAALAAAKAATAHLVALATRGDVEGMLAASDACGAATARLVAANAALVDAITKG